jgi:4-hydroxybenzoate polyprenyltransferase
VLAKMRRTCQRPLAAGRINLKEAFMVGLALSVFGIGLALVMDWLFKYASVYMLAAMILVIIGVG